MQVPFYYFTFGGNERRNAIVVCFASVPFFLAWVSLLPKASFPLQYLAGSSASFQYPPMTFVWVFLSNDVRLHINNEHWWVPLRVPQGMAALLSHMMSAK